MSCDQVSFNPISIPEYNCKPTHKDDELAYQANQDQSYQVNRIRPKIGQFPLNNGQLSQDIETLAAPQEPQTAKNTHTHCCQKLTKRQCIFLVVGLAIFIAGIITLGVVLSRRWVQRSHFATKSDKIQIHTEIGDGFSSISYRINLTQKHLFSSDQQDHLTITQVKRVNSQDNQDNRKLQQGGGQASNNSLILVTDHNQNGSVIIQSDGVGSQRLLVDISKIHEQISSENPSQNNRLLLQLVNPDDIANQVAAQLNVSPDQVQVIVQNRTVVQDNSGSNANAQQNQQNTESNANNRNLLRNERNSHDGDYARRTHARRVAEKAASMLREAEQRIRKHQKLVTQLGFLIAFVNQMVKSERVTENEHSKIIQTVYENCRFRSDDQDKYQDTKVIEEAQLKEKNDCHVYNKKKYCTISQHQKVEQKRSKFYVIKILTKKEARQRSQRRQRQAKNDDKKKSTNTTNKTQPTTPKTDDKKGSSSNATPNQKPSSNSSNSSSNSSSSATPNQPSAPTNNSNSNKSSSTATPNQPSTPANNSNSNKSSSTATPNQPSSTVKPNQPSPAVATVQGTKLSTTQTAKPSSTATTSKTNAAATSNQTAKTKTGGN